VPRSISAMNNRHCSTGMREEMLMSIWESGLGFALAASSTCRWVNFFQRDANRSIISASVLQAAIRLGGMLSASA
jgi:hypothetical protein